MRVVLKPARSRHPESPSPNEVGLTRDGSRVPPHANEGRRAPGSARPKFGFRISSPARITAARKFVWETLGYGFERQHIRSNTIATWPAKLEPILADIGGGAPKPSSGKFL